jgi:Putative DNA-binding domain
VDEQKRQDIGNKALAAARESKRIEFKREFNPSESGAWCELFKDIVAMANSGGGVVLVGLESDGSPSGIDPSELIATDPADITNNLARYVRDQFDGFEISEPSKDGHRLAMISVQSKTGSPLVFEKPGTYTIADGKQRTAFSRGTIYFRHGAKSEPATANDIAKYVNNELASQRREILNNVRRVSQAPRDSKIVVVSAETGPNETVNKFKIVDDPDAPAIARTDYDVTHPYRQKELIATINDRVGSKVVGPYEILSVRRVYKIDDRPEFFRRPKFSNSPQFSDAFVSWLITEYQSDADFFKKATTTYGSMRK